MEKEEEKVDLVEQYQVRAETNVEIAGILVKENKNTNSIDLVTKVAKMVNMKIIPDQI